MASIPQLQLGFEVSAFCATTSLWFMGSLIAVQKFSTDFAGYTHTTNDRWLRCLLSLTCCLPP